MLHNVVIQNVVLFLVGISGGILVSGGMYALITTLGIINRIAQDTHTAQDILFYEECVIWGATLGNILFVFDIKIPFGTPALIIFGFIGGIYAGCLAIALAEIIKTIPVFIMRSGITRGFGFLILMMALGKGIGGLIYFFVFNFRIPPS